MLGTYAAAAGGGGITVESIPGTYEPTSPDHSNKRPRLDFHVDYDNDDYCWMIDGWVLNDTYDMLTSDEVLSRMVRGCVTAERFLSKAAQLKLDANIIQLLNQQLVPSFKDLLTSVRKLGTDVLGNDDNYPEMLRLVNLAKRILQLWHTVENEIPLPDMSSPSSFLYMAPVDYPHPVPSAWLFEYRWRDKAYAEVLSIRKKYSYLLDEAYRNSYSSYLGKNGNSGSISLSHKKLLIFMASSREDLDFLNVKKCYKRVMSIKKLCTFMDLACASGKLTDQTKLPNWRDDIYNQVAACRKMYSLDLDKLLRDEVDKMQSATPDKASKERRSFLEESLQFLANSRADIAILKEEYCRKQLAVIKHRLEDTEDFLASKQSAVAPLSPCQTGLAKLPTNWLDLEYVALQNKAVRFTYEVYDVYLKHQPVWSKIPAFNEDLKKLESHMARALKFYRMRRGEMSLLFVSKDGYYNACWGSLREDVRECIDLIRLLVEKEGTKPSWDFHRLSILIPKLAKFAELFE